MISPVKSVDYKPPSLLCWDKNNSIIGDRVGISACHYSAADCSVIFQYHFLSALSSWSYASCIVVYPKWLSLTLCCLHLGCAWIFEFSVNHLRHHLNLNTQTSIQIFAMPCILFSLRVHLNTEQNKGNTFKIITNNGHKSGTSNCRLSPGATLHAAL